MLMHAVCADRPWSWRVAPAPIFRKIEALASAWTPSAAIGLDQSELRAALAHSARCRRRWLLHPMVFAVGLAAEPDIRQARDFQLAVWLAAHGAMAAQPIVSPCPLWLWSGEGGCKIDAGTHDLARLAKELAAAESTERPALDIWCHTLRLTVSGSWASRCESLSDQEEATLQAELELFFRAWALLQHFLPDCCDWILEGTSVVIPLRGINASEFNSRSTPDFPGLVEMDLAGGVMQILEALVHETAHQYLYRAEAEAPLIEPGYDGLHHSPLRVEQRPLRGILLAWHALAFISCLYREASARGLYRSQAEGELPRLLTLLDEAETVMSAQQSHLTGAGAAFYRSTAMVADHARH